jgi:hypothetical protein
MSPSYSNAAHTSSRGLRGGLCRRSRRLQAWAGHQLDVLALQLGSALLAVEAGVGGAAAVDVAEQLRSSAFGQVVLVAPEHQLGDYAPEVAALLRQDVFVALGALLIGPAFEDAFVDEALESIGENLLRHAQTALELVETRLAPEGVANDEHRPALPDDLERAGHGADLFVVCAR